MEYRESLPPRDVVCIGIPITGIGNNARTYPAMSCHTGAGDNHLYAPLLRGLVHIQKKYRASDVQK